MSFFFFVLSLMCLFSSTSASTTLKLTVVRSKTLVIESRPACRNIKMLEVSVNEGNLFGNFHPASKVSTPVRSGSKSYTRFEFNFMKGFIPSSRVALLLNIVVSDNVKISTRLTSAVSVHAVPTCVAYERPFPVPKPTMEYEEVCNVSCPTEVDACGVESLNDTNYPDKPLPGSSFFSKVYNMLDGREVHEKHGRDILRWTWAKSHYTLYPSSTFQWDSPVEFGNSKPNLIPQCHQMEVITELKDTSSFTIIDQQSTGKDFGYDINAGQVGAILSAVPDASAQAAGKLLSSDALKNLGISLSFSNSQQSKTTKKMKKSGYEKTANVWAQTAWYEGFVDWNEIDKFHLRHDFLLALQELGDSCTKVCRPGGPCKYKFDNVAIAKFIFRWGTHVFSKAKMGATCRESLYARTLDESNEYSSFMKELEKNKAKILFWSLGSDATSTFEQSGTWESQVKYSFENIQCVGEMPTNHKCGEITGKNYLPEPIEYEMVPFWKLKICKRYMNDCVILGMKQFVLRVMYALSQCRDKHCNKRGECVLKPNVFTHQFLCDWKGNFTELVDYSAPCYCDPPYFGDNCDQEPKPVPASLSCIEDSSPITQYKSSWDSQYFPSKTPMHLLSGFGGTHDEFGISADDTRYRFRWCQIQPTIKIVEEHTLGWTAKGSGWTIACPANHAISNIFSQWGDRVNWDRRTFEFKCVRFEKVTWSNCMTSYSAYATPLPKNQEWMYRCPPGGNGVVVAINTNYDNHIFRSNRRWRFKCCRLTINP